VGVLGVRQCGGPGGALGQGLGLPHAPVGRHGHLGQTDVLGETLRGQFWKRGWTLAVVPSSENYDFQLLDDRVLTIG
jgi:hypothetical protein